MKNTDITIEELDTKLETKFNLAVRAILAGIKGHITIEEREALLDMWDTEGKEEMRQALAEAEKKGREECFFDYGNKTCKGVMRNICNSHLREVQKDEAYINLKDKQ